MKNHLKYRVETSNKESIEPEEIFFDPTNLAADSMGQVEVPIKKRNILIFSLIVASFLLVLGGKPLYLQLSQYDYFSKIAEANRSRKVGIDAPRGIIFDRFGHQLVFNEPSFALIAIPAFMPNNSPDRSKIIENISTILAEPEDEIQSMVKEHGDYFFGEIILKGNLDRQTTLSLEGQINEMEGVYLTQKNSRKYPDNEYLSHVLGYVGKVSAEDLLYNDDYSINDSIGKVGAEAYYEKTLRGIDGEKKFEVGKFRESDGVVSTKDPVPGKDILLTIDYNLQKKLQDAMSKKLKSLNERKAAGIIIDPMSGEILAMASFPSFDNNAFIDKTKDKELKNIFSDPAKPLFNRAISGTYPPGSTLKPFMGAAILEEELISPYKKIYAAGSISIQNQFNPEIVYTFRDWKEHGLVNMIDAIAYSSNVYFYTFGGGYQGAEGLGIERIVNYLKQFNFGQTLGIDLANESSGLIPDPVWKEVVKNEPWYQGDTYNTSIGQGDITATPLQLVAATGYLSTNDWYKPHIVKEIIDGDKNTKITPISLPNHLIDQSNIEIIRQGMREAVRQGSARALANLPVAAAGKTGTAQSGGNKEHHAWFTGFAPFNNPKIAITILIEEGGEGSAAAVPVAKEVMEWYFSNYKY